MKHILSDIYIYPVKSLAGIKFDEAEVTERGLKNDRRWMLVDENNQYLTQRTISKMALINVELENGLIKFSVKNSTEKFEIDTTQPAYQKSKIIVWEDLVDAELVSHAADEWFSDILKIKCRLVHMPDEAKRFVSKNYAKNNEVVSFADGFPFLIIGQSSLDDLNNRIGDTIPMNRFRPNFVFTGGEPFDEDRIESFTMNDIKFFPVKPCSRCIITTIDQSTGAISKEPLKTLSAYRKINKRIMFGQNLLHEGSGIIKVGTELRDIKWKE